MTDVATRRRKAANQRAYRMRHLERVRAIERASFDRRRAERNAARRARYTPHPPTKAAAINAAHVANRRARMYGVDGVIGYETVIELWRREPVCVDCGAGRGLDHVVPMSLGGSNTSGNLANRCRSCNSRKGTKLPALEHTAFSSPKEVYP